MNQAIYEKRMQALGNLHYLPLFYLIPDEIAAKRKLDGFPRDPYLVATTKEWLDTYNSKHFQVLLMDTWGWMMWQCLGIRGGSDSFSHNDPMWKITFHLPMWVWLLAELGITTDFLASFEHGTEIPFLTMESAVFNCDQIAKVFWGHPKLNMKKVYEVVRTHRDHRDFSSRMSNVKIDFQRQYYHTRASTKVISDSDENGEPVYAPMTNAFDEVETRLWFDVFLKRLDEKDRQIVKLLEEGYTQQEIAKNLGYANHSAVAKRYKKIKRAFNLFRQE